ncbi:MAG: hypothetical protein ABI222_01310, partial [Opitutaceae bacterium]
MLIVITLLAGIGWLAIKLNRSSAEFRHAAAEFRQIQSHSVAENAGLRREVATLRKETTVAVKSASQAEQAAPPANTSVDITEYIEAQPGYAAYRKRSLQDQIFLRYGDLKSLNLEPEKLQQLQQLLVDQLAAPGDAMAAAQKQGIPFASSAYNELIGVATQQAGAAILNFLGKAGYAALQARQQHIQLLATVQNDLGVRLALAGDPLTADQTGAMTDLMVQFRQRGY